MKRSKGASIQAIVDASQQTELVIISHGYADYMRDYEVLTAHYEGVDYVADKLLQFVGCVSCDVTSQIDPRVYAKSLSWPVVDDADEHFAWEVRCSTAQYGITLIEDEDEDVARWSRCLGVEMFKASLISEAFSLVLIFHDLRSGIVKKNSRVCRSFPLQE